MQLVFLIHWRERERSSCSEIVLFFGMYLANRYSTNTVFNDWVREWMNEWTFQHSAFKILLMRQVMYFFCDLFLLIHLFFLFLEREREKARARGRQGRGERKNLKQVPCPAQSAMQGSIPWPWDHNLSQNKEADTPLTEPPGAPCISYIHVELGLLSIRFL